MMIKLNSHPFEPNYQNILKVLYNQKPQYLPLYEHNIDEPFISKFLQIEVCSNGKSGIDLEDHYNVVCNFWKRNTYDAMSYEAKVCDIYPEHGAIFGGKLGPIQTREDFNKYPWDELPHLFVQTYKPHLDALQKVMPLGMKAYGGCGYGIFESAEDLVGYESLCLMQYLDPELFRDLFIKIGDLYVVLWKWLLNNYDDLFVFYRMGDDLGYRTSTLLEPSTIIQHILPQHKRIINLVHSYGKKFLLHSCGNIFAIMEELIANGIDAKHSNEDQIAPFSEWIKNYNDRIGLFGGFDMNTLIQNSYDTVFDKVLTEGSEFRLKTKGYGLGSGNSIPDYMTVEGFTAMIDATKEIRRREAAGLLK